MNEIILTKELKIKILHILKRGKITRTEVKELIKDFDLRMSDFDLVLTIAESREFLKMIEAEI